MPKAVVLTAGEIWEDMNRNRLRQVSPELERAAARRARDRANDARWNLDVAIFLFAVTITVFILSFQGIRIEIVAPIALFGLAMAWLVGWRQGRQLYQRFYDEELSAGEIVVICAWCGKEMRRERGLGQSIASHGICPECVQKNFPETLTTQIDRRGRKDGKQR